jgi:NAD(P)-dependent dehydrogenase (short-subunit alcohol dehydrogenase family)
MAAPTDPRTRFPQPPFPARKEQQPAPGNEANLDPPADHGSASYQGHGRLQDRIAIITGADSGIGRAIAVCFAKEGADLVLASLPEEQEDLQATARLVEQEGRRALTVTGDIRQKSHAQELVGKALSSFGGLHIVVNNAAFQRTYSSIQDIPEDELDTTFRTNVFGTFFLTQAALAEMKPGGVILNTTSIEAFEPKNSLAPYAATKAAIASLTRSLSLFAIEQGVRINAVAPGPVWTPLIPSTMPPGQVEQFGKSSAFGRPAQPVEQAAVFVFLASDDASYITGEIYGATGGKMPL